MYEWSPWELLSAQTENQSETLIQNCLLNSSCWTLGAERAGLISELHHADHLDEENKATLHDVIWMISE